MDIISTVKDVCVAKNEDGEFELVLGNNQLLSVFFLVVLLLALCFVGGYVVGKNAAPTLAAAPAASPKAQGAPEVLVAAPEVLVAKEESVREEPNLTPAKAVVSEPEPEPLRPAPKVEAKPESAPVPVPVAVKQASVASQPIAGRVYLQLSATDKDRAEMMVDLIRSKNLPAIAAGIADRPNLYRVLVGPLTDAELPETREQLKANSFPADEAIRRVF